MSTNRLGSSSESLANHQLKGRRGVCAGAGDAIKAWGGLAQGVSPPTGGWWGKEITGACFHLLGLVELPQLCASSEPESLGVGYVRWVCRTGMSVQSNRGPVGHSTRAVSRNADL